MKIFTTNNLRRLFLLLTVMAAGVNSVWGNIDWTNASLSGVQSSKSQDGLTITIENSSYSSNGDKGLDLGSISTSHETRYIVCEAKDGYSVNVTKVDIRANAYASSGVFARYLKFDNVGDYKSINDAFHSDPYNGGKTFTSTNSKSGKSVSYPIEMYSRSGYAHYFLTRIAVEYILSANQYVVTFDVNHDGANVTPTSKQVTFDATYKTLPTPTREDYDFDGWYTAAIGGSIVTASTSVKTASNHTLYAHWTIHEYNVYYELDGGTNNVNNPSTYTIESSTITLENPTKSGYNFEGWYETSDFSGDPVMSIPTGSTGDKTFYAKWTAQAAEYTVTFDANNGSTSLTTLTMIYGRTTNNNVGASSATRSGYNFKGWYDEAMSGYQAFNINGSYFAGQYWDEEGNWKGTSDDVTLYAHWAPLFYFSAAADKNIAGGTVTATLANVSPIEGELSQTSATTTATFTATENSGFHFEGWFSESALDNLVSDNLEYSTSLVNNTIGSTTSITLYAKYVQEKNANFTGSDQNLTVDATYTGFEWSNTSAEKPVLGEPSGDFYYEIINNTPSGITTGSDHPSEIIGYDPETNTLTAYNAGTATIRFVQKQIGYYYNAQSREFTITVTKENPVFTWSTEPLYDNGIYSSYFESNSKGSISVNSSTNPGVAVLATTAESNMLDLRTISSGTASLKVTQDENYRYYSKTENKNVTVSERLNHVEFTIINSNHSNFEVTKNDTKWNGSGYKLGTGTINTFNKADANVVVGFTGIPENLTFVKSLDRAAGLFPGSGDCKCYVYESSNGSDWTLIWENGEREETTASGTIVLNPNTRYLKFRYVGTVYANYSNIHVTELKYLRTSGALPTTFADTQRGAVSGVQSFLVEHANANMITSITAPDHFEVSVDGVNFFPRIDDVNALLPSTQDKVGRDLMGSFRVYVRFHPTEVGIAPNKSGNVVIASAGYSDVNVHVSATAIKANREIVWDIPTSTNIKVDKSFDLAVSNGDYNAAYAETNYENPAGTVSYSIVSMQDADNQDVPGAATLDGSTITFNKAATITVRATAEATSEFNAAYAERTWVAQLLTLHFTTAPAQNGDVFVGDSKSTDILTGGLVVADENGHSPVDGNIVLPSSGTFDVAGETYMTINFNPNNIEKYKAFSYDVPVYVKKGDLNILANPTVAKVYYHPGLKLSEVSLQGGAISYKTSVISGAFMWENADADLEEGVQSCLAKFIPHDNDNYNVLEHISISVNVVLYTYQNDKGWDQSQSWNEKPADDNAYVRIDAPLEITKDVKVSGVEIVNDASITIAPYASLTVGEYGIMGANVENLILQAATTGEHKGKTGILKMAKTIETPYAQVQLFSDAYNEESASSQWQYVGVPVLKNNADIQSNSDDVEYTTMAGDAFPNAKLQVWSNAAQRWGVPASDKSMSPFAAYLTAQSVSPSGAKYDIKGKLINSDYTVTLSEDKNKELFYRLANSYTAPIDIAAFTDGDFTGDAEATIYLYKKASVDEWNSAVSTGNQAQFRVAYPIHTASLIAEMGGTSAVIPSMQGFMVHFPNGKAGSVTLDYERLVLSSDKGAQALQASARRMADYVEFKVAVSLQGKSHVDRCYLFESESYAASFENGYDARQIASSDEFAIFTNENGARLSVDATNNIAGTYLGFNAVEDTVHTLSFPYVETAEPLYLQDLANDSIIEVEQGTAYSFTADSASDNSLRFRLLNADMLPAEYWTGNGDNGGSEIITPVVPEEPIVTALNSTTATTALWMSDGSLYATANGASAIVLYDLNGRMIMSRSFRNAGSLSLENLPAGVYMAHSGSHLLKIVR